MDFKEIINCIFYKKDKYWEISDDDKEKNFFIINRKFARRYPKVAQIFNNKNINKSDALDRWFFHFENQKTIPSWYWASRKKKTSKKKVPSADIFLLRNRLDISENDINFLYDNYHECFNKYLKKVKSY